MKILKNAQTNLIERVRAKYPDDINIIALESIIKRANDTTINKIDNIRKDLDGIMKKKISETTSLFDSEAVSDITNILSLLKTQPAKDEAEEDIVEEEEVEKPVAKAKVEKPVEPKVTKPEIAKPEVTKPEVQTVPEVTTPIQPVVQPKPMVKPNPIAKPATQIPTRPSTQIPAKPAAKTVIKPTIQPAKTQIPVTKVTTSALDDLANNLD